MIYLKPLFTHSLYAISVFKSLLWQWLIEPPSAWVLGFYFFRILKGRVVGSENLIPPPYILAFNHSSYLDWLLVYYVFSRHYGIEVFFLAKTKLNTNPVWRACVVYGKAIVIDYDNKRSIRKALLQMRAHLGNRHVVGIFPEGTRSVDGLLQAPQQGVAWLAIKANVPIIPVALKGFYEAWPRHSLLPGKACCTIRIGTPIFQDQASNRPGVMQKLMGNLAQLLAEQD
jgi:1-acyl-sn-glycerol-3-phosphate acyltransferase